MPVSHTMSEIFRVTLKSGSLEVWYDTKAWVPFPIRILEQLLSYL